MQTLLVGHLGGKLLYANPQNTRMHHYGAFAWTKSALHLQVAPSIYVYG